jgi:hypothetical protein
MPQAKQQSENHRTHVGVFMVSHSFNAAYDSNSSTWMLSMVGPVSSTFSMSSLLISRSQTMRLR